MFGIRQETREPYLVHVQDSHLDLFFEGSWHSQADVPQPSNLVEHSGCAFDRLVSCQRTKKENKQRADHFEMSWEVERSSQMQGET